MFYYFLSLSINRIIIISVQNLKLKIKRKLSCTFPLIFMRNQLLTSAIL